MLINSFRFTRKVLFKLCWTYEVEVLCDEAFLSVSQSETPYLKNCSEDLSNFLHIGREKYEKADEAWFWKVIWKTSTETVKTFLNKKLSKYLCGYRKRCFTTNYLLLKMYMFLKDRENYTKNFLVSRSYIRYSSKCE